MKVHYFQRYHQKENVATANSMLLLSRLYSFSSEKFFAFLKSACFSDTFSPEIEFVIQEKNESSVPDATITQQSFKIVIETKLTDWFYKEQLINHLKAFSGEKYKVMITLASEPMEKSKKETIDKAIMEYNKTQSSPVIHINTTFEEVADAVGDVLDDRDYDMQNILSDYLDYCYSDGLIPKSDAWKFMRVPRVGTTFDFNFKSNVYYEGVDRGVREHDTLGLYRWKSVRAIGKIEAIITAIETDAGIEYEALRGELTEEKKETIVKAMDDAVSYGYDLRSYKHRYYFVEKFYETDFKKISPRAPMGTRVFDLTQVLGTDEIPNIEELAIRLRKETWS